MQDSACIRHQGPLPTPKLINKKKVGGSKAEFFPITLVISAWVDSVLTIFQSQNLVGSGERFGAYVWG